MQNRNGSDFRQCSGKKNNTGSHHVDGCYCCELYHSHFLLLDKVVPFFLNPNRMKLALGEKYCPGVNRMMQS